MTLVHSRKTLLNKFGTKLHDAAVATLEELGVRVVLGQRIGPHEEKDTRIALSSGETIPCDLLVCPRLIGSWRVEVDLLSNFKNQRSDVQARKPRRKSSPTFVQNRFRQQVDF